MIIGSIALQKLIISSKQIIGLSDEFIGALQTEAIKIVGRFEVCGQQLPPAVNFSTLFPSELLSLVNTLDIENLFGNSRLPLERMVVEDGNRIIKSRIALYTSTATTQMTRSLVNEAPDSIVHVLFRVHGSLNLPVAVMALSAMIVSN